MKNYIQLLHVKGALRPPKVDGGTDTDSAPSQNPKVIVCLITGLISEQHQLLLQKKLLLSFMFRRVKSTVDKLCTQVGAAMHMNTSQHLNFL